MYVVCATADIAPKFIDATTPATNIPTATIETPNLKLFFMLSYTTQFLLKDYHKADCIIDRGNIDSRL